MTGAGVPAAWERRDGGADPGCPACRGWRPCCAAWALMPTVSLYYSFVTLGFRWPYRQDQRKPCF